jgi:hypothetical protein
MSYDLKCLCLKLRQKIPGIEPSMRPMQRTRRVSLEGGLLHVGPGESISM